MNTYNFSSHIGGSSPLFDITNQRGLEKAKKSISNLNLSRNDYANIYESNSSNKIYVKKGEKNDKDVKITFGPKAHNCQIIFLGKTSGNIHIKIIRKNSTIIIGDRCKTGGVLTIKSSQDADFVALGNSILFSGDCSIYSGVKRPHKDGNPFVIMGDNCIVSVNVTIRNTDSHPIYDEEGNVVNFPNKGIHIDKKVWLGQNVVILKNCNYIAEGIIVGISSVVTKSFSTPNIIIAGSPARVLHNGKKFYWKY